MRKKLIIISFLSFWMVYLGVSLPLFCQRILSQEDYACQSLDKGEIEKAIEILEKELKTMPNNLDAHLYLGIACYLKKDLETAYKEFEKIEKELEKVVGASRPFGDESLFTQMGMERKRALIFSEERKGLFYFCRGLTLKEKKDLKNAEKNFIKAKKQHYDEKSLALELVDLFLKKKDLKSVSRELEDLKKISGENHVFTFLDAYLKYENNDIEAALAAYEKVETQVPEAIKNRGRIYYNRGEFQRAVEIWEKALSQQPDDKEAQINLGRAYFHLNDAQKAQEYFDKAGIKISPAQYSPKNLPLIFDLPFGEKKFSLMCKS